MRLKLRRGEDWQENRMESAGYCFGGDGGDSSSSNTNTTQTTTTNVDKRQVLNGGVGVTSDQSTVTVTNNTLDAGIATAAIDAVKSADVVNGDGFDKLLGLADKLFTGAGQILTKTQDTALGQIASLNTAANDSKGAIDQKTIVVIALAGVAALALRKG